MTNDIETTGLETPEAHASTSPQPAPQPPRRLFLPPANRETLGATGVIVTAYAKTRRMSQTELCDLIRAVREALS